MRETSTSRDPGLKAAIKAAGGVTALALAIGVKPQAISQWSQIPLGRLLEVERATGVHRSKLCPEFFKEAPAAQQVAS